MPIRTTSIYVEKPAPYFCFLSHTLLSATTYGLTFFHNSLSGWSPPHSLPPYLYTMSPWRVLHRYLWYRCHVWLVMLQRAQSFTPPVAAGFIVGNGRRWVVRRWRGPLIIMTVEVRFRFKGPPLYAFYRGSGSTYHGRCSAFPHMKVLVSCGILAS